MKIHDSKDRFVFSKFAFTLYTLGLSDYMYATTKLMSTSYPAEG